MAQAIDGKDYLLFFRAWKNRATDAGAKLAFQTEHSIDMSKETETTSTKDGNINTIADGDNTISITSIAYREDTGTATVWEKLKEHYKANELVEVWEVDRNSLTTDGKYKADYYQGFLSSFTKSAPSDAQSELEMEYAINGNGVSGEVTLSDAQQAVAQYVFHDLEPVPAEV